MGKKDLNISWINRNGSEFDFTGGKEFLENSVRIK